MQPRPRCCETTTGSNWGSAPPGSFEVVCCEPPKLNVRRCVASLSHLGARMTGPNAFGSQRVTAARASKRGRSPRPLK
jgi:hypothetical protein